MNIPITEEDALREEVSNVRVHTVSKMNVFITGEDALREEVSK